MVFILSESMMSDVEIKSDDFGFNKLEEGGHPESLLLLCSIRKYVNAVAFT